MLRHVLAAALHADVDMLVTDDRTAFPENALQGRLDVYTADEFLVWVADNHTHLLRPVLEKQVAYFRKNAIVTGGERSEDRLIEVLQKAGANTFAEHLRSLTVADIADQTEAVVAQET